MRYEIDVGQSFAGQHHSAPPGYSMSRNAAGSVDVVRRITVDTPTLQEAFSKAVDQFLDDMTQAGWSGLRVTSGIHAEHVIHGLQVYAPNVP